MAGEIFGVPYHVTATYGETTIGNIISVALPEEIRDIIELERFTGTGKRAQVLSPDVTAGECTIVAAFAPDTFTSLSPKKATSGAAESTEDLVISVSFDGEIATITMKGMVIAGRSGGDFSRGSEINVTYTFQQHDPTGALAISAVVVLDSGA